MLIYHRYKSIVARPVTPSTETILPPVYSGIPQQHITRPPVLVRQEVTLAPARHCAALWGAMCKWRELTLRMI